MERRGRSEGEREVRMIEEELQQEIVELERIYGRERGREVNVCGIDSLTCCKRFELGLCLDKRRPKNAHTLNTLHCTRTVHN